MRANGPGPASWSAQGRRMSALLTPRHTSSPVSLLRRHDLWHPERELASGHIVRLARGVYAATSEWTVLRPWEKYLAHVHAAALVQPDAIFSHESAAALWGLPLFGQPAAVHVLGDPDASSRLASGIRTHSTVDARQIVELDGFRVTAPTEVVIDHARSRHPAVALAVADATLRAFPGTSVEQLTATNEARSSSRGRRKARWSITRADARAERALESVSRAAMEWLGFEEPDLQWEIRHPDGTLDRIDFRWAHRLILGEADGAMKYSGRFGDPTVAVLSEKRREDRLRRLVHGFARWGWRQVSFPAELRGILEAAGLPLVRPEQSAPLLSLRAAINGSVSTLVEPAASPRS
jgi:hypothetical protein